MRLAITAFAIGFVLLAAFVVLNGRGAVGMGEEAFRMWMNTRPILALRWGITLCFLAGSVLLWRADKEAAEEGG